jgi:hypothetical protein
LKEVFKQLSGLCEFNASIENLLKLTSLPQKDQNSEFITFFYYLLEEVCDLSLILGFERLIVDVFGLYTGRIEQCGWLIDDQRSNFWV